MSANIIDLHVYKGSDFKYVLNVKFNNSNINLDDYTFRGSINNNGEITSLTVTELTEGNLELSLTNTQTALFQGGLGIYDIEMVNDSNGEVAKILKGRVYIDEEVTV